MVRNRREMKPAFLQKGFMLIVGIIVLGSFIMTIIQSIGYVPSDIFGAIYYFLRLSAIFGFLLGNNVKTVI